MKSCSFKDTIGSLKQVVFRGQDMFLVLETAFSTTCVLIRSSDLRRVCGSLPAFVGQGSILHINKLKYFKDECQATEDTRVSLLRGSISMLRPREGPTTSTIAALSQSSAKPYELFKIAADIQKITKVHISTNRAPSRFAHTRAGLCFHVLCRL